MISPFRSVGYKCEKAHQTKKDESPYPNTDSPSNQHGTHTNNMFAVAGISLGTSSFVSHVHLQGSNHTMSNGQNDLLPTPPQLVWLVSDQTKPNQTKTKPNQTRPTKTKPSQGKPNQTKQKPTKNKNKPAKPNQSTQPNPAQPTQPKPTQGVPPSTSPSKTLLPFGYEF